MDMDQKQAAVKEIGEALSASSAVFAIDYRGISVGQAAELRGRLSEADASFSVVKNRLAKRVTAESGTEALDEHLVGPTALTYVRGDAVLAAKAINDFIRANQTISYKGGIMDGEALDVEQFGVIARLPGVDVLRGQLVGLAASPLSGLVRTLNQLIAGVALQLGQIAEQGLVAGEAPAAPAEAEAEAEAADDGGGDAGGDGEPEVPETGDPGGKEEPAPDAEPPAEPETKPDDDGDGAEDAADATDGADGGERASGDESDETETEQAGGDDQSPEAEETKED